MKKATIIATVAFFATIKLEKKMMMHCFLFILKHRKEGDDNKLPSPSLLQQNHARK
jgi:hypothetical protein